MFSVSESLQRHVPAWKKLGLKLKFAKEVPGDAQPSQNDPINCKKRKALTVEEAVEENAPRERSAKKVKKSKSRAEGAREAVNGNGTCHGPRDDGKPRKMNKHSESNIEDSTEGVNGNAKSSSEPLNTEKPSKNSKRAGKSKVKADVSRSSVNGESGSTHKQESSPPLALRTTHASKRKSVSFTPDTKTKDGDGVKGLYKSWIANQKALDPSFDPLTVSPSLRAIVPSIVASQNSPTPSSLTSTSTSKSEPTINVKKKPPKKPKTRLPKTSSGPSPSRFDPVLTYLTTHHTSPQDWKFSKPHQNQILKHLFSLNHIPSSYDTALLPYIRGLKGASARSRLRKEALAVRKEDKEWLAAEHSESNRMENETASQCIARRRRDYEAAVARIKRTLREKEEEREARDWDLLGEKAEWEERIRKRRRAEIVLWNVGEEEEEEEEAAEADGVAVPQQDTFGRDARHCQMHSGIAQLVQAARDPGPAPRVGRGVGMGMGGVEVIDADGIARGSQGRKVVFGDDGCAQASASNRVNGLGGANGVGRVNGVRMPDAGNGTNGAKPKRRRKHKRRTGVPDDDETSSSESSSSSSSEESEEEQQQQPPRVPEEGGSEESSDDETSSSSGDSDSS